MIEPASTETDAESAPADTKTNPVASIKKKPRFNPNANHGRYGASDYTGCPVIEVPHDTLHPGSDCPSCTEVALSGRLTAVLPQVVVRLTGSPLVSGLRYEAQRLRCSLCQEYYVAKLPEEVTRRGKYDETCRTNIAIAHYYAGQPFYRIEQLQAAQGIPLADATQWDLMAQLYKILYPVYRLLETLAAQGTLLHYDDTGHRILQAYAPQDRKTVHTTAFISHYEEHQIYLFFTSLNHAGENIASLLGQRVTDEPLITMSDASAQNIPKKVDEDLMARWILCFCLVHGRRKFYELQHLWGKECEAVLDIIAEVYKHEAHCKQHQLSPVERLRYHQIHSSTSMQALLIWLNNQLVHQQVEPNSALGQAIHYMLRHWKPLTRFLHVAGAPIDNSVCEQAIKVAIRYRRNSLFYKTYFGAKVGDTITSLIHTCAKNKINFFDYLNTLQRYYRESSEQPAQWLPWNYQATLAAMSKALPLAA